MDNECPWCGARWADDVATLGETKYKCGSWTNGHPVEREQSNRCRIICLERRVQDLEMWRERHSGLD